jgi:hypothetical protein
MLLDTAAVSVGFALWGFGINPLTIPLMIAHTKQSIITKAARLMIFR